MPASALPLPFDEYLTRVNDEANKAACYRIAALATRHVPDLERRWASSPTQLAYTFMRDGTHMAFLVTLAALLEETNRPDIVNLHRLLGRLDDAAVRREIALRRRMEPAAVYSRARVLRARFTERVTPLVLRVKEVRDNVVAHHGRTIDWPATIGLLNRIMVRVVVLVDALNELATGECTNISENVRVVRSQATSLWSKGIDGDPDVALGREDHDEWDGLQTRRADRS